MTESSFLSFIVVGGHKCATTWLYDMLRQHRSLQLANKKELHFFSLHFNLGVGWYESHWPNGGARLRGEVSPSYYVAKLYLDRAQRVFPKVKYILVYRDPLQRLRSHVWHIMRQERRASADEILTKYPIVIENSRFYESLSFFNGLASERRLLLFYDDIVKAPLETLRKIERFLGVEVGAYSHVDQVSGGGFFPRSALVEWLRNAVFSATYSRAWVHNALRSSGAVRVLLNANRTTRPALEVPDWAVTELREDARRIAEERLIERLSSDREMG